MDFIEAFQVKRLPKYAYNYCVEKKYVLMNLDLGVYWLWAALRIILTLMPQTGYIHPDEYFQSVEVLAGNAFGTESNVPWEFNATFPIRSIPAIYLSIYIPMCILRTISELIESIVGLNVTTHYLMLVVPRLSMCMLSFVSDVCLFKICYSFGQNYKERLVIFASSFISLVFMTRTFTNAIEIMCFNVLLCLVALSMADSESTSFQNSFLANKFSEATTIPDRVRIKKLLKLIPQHTLSRCVPIAIVTVTGFFNRPTFLLFAFTPLFYWFQRGLNVASTFLKDFHIRIFVFVLYCIPVIFFFVYFDSVYYGYITWGEVLNMDIGFKNFVVTPYNFLKYNLDLANLSKHGLHPRFLHILVNIPLLFNVLGLSGLLVVIKLVYRGTLSDWTLLPKSQSITGMMTLSFVAPVLCLTVIPHQEPRFITPILLPLIFLYSHLIRDFEEEQKTVEPFRKRYRKRIDVPESGVLKYPLKCMAYLEEATENIDNRYNISGREMALLQEQEIVEASRKGRNFDQSMRERNMREGSWEGEGAWEGRRKRGSDLMKAWYLLNLVCVLFYGFLHQGGMYGLTKDFRDKLALKPRYTTYHLITSHVYSVPVHLFDVKKSYKSKNTNFALYELGSEKLEKLNGKLSTIVNLAESTKKSARRNYKVYVSLPASLITEFTSNLKESPGNLTYHIEDVFYPHLSTEALPGYSLNGPHFKFSDRFGVSNLLNFPPFRYLLKWIHQFSLVLLEIKVPESKSESGKILEPFKAENTLGSG